MHSARITYTRGNNKELFIARPPQRVAARTYM
jgi:hypothetical protein